MSTDDYVATVLGTWEECDIYEGLMWSVKGGAVQFSAICSDLFYWGCADAEDIIAPDDLDLLKQCLADLQAADDTTYLIGELFAARKRGMRPQTPWGRTYDRENSCYTEDNLLPSVRALFDACGPVR